MASIFSLFGEILIDNTNADKSIDTTTKKAEKSGGSIGTAFGKIAKGAAAVGTAVVAGASAVGTAAFSMATSTAGVADEIDKMSQKLGMSREAYQEWDYVLSQAGVEITSMSTGLKTLTNKIDDAKNGSKKASEMFDKLGISLEDLNSMSREEVFDAVIAGMQGMEDSTERAALANDLFGKSGQELTALFNETAESTEILKNKAHELGMVMSDEAIDAGVQFTDSLDTLKRSMGGVFNLLGAAILPIVTVIIDLITSKMPEIQSLFARLTPILMSLFDGILPPLFSMVETLLPILFDLLETLLPVFESIITAILPVLVDLIQLLLPFFVQIIQDILPIFIELIEAIMPLFAEILQAVLPVLIELFQRLLPPLIEIIEAILPVVIDLIRLILPLVTQIIQSVLPVLLQLLDTFAPIFRPILSLIQSVLSPLMDLLNVILPPIISVLTFIFEHVLPPLQAAFSVVSEVISTVFSGALESLGPIIEAVTGIFEGIITFVKNVFTGNWEEAWNGVKQIFANIWEAMKTVFKAPVNWIIDGINGFIRGLNKIQIPDWVPVLGGKGLNIKEIPRLRVGIDYVPYDDYPALLHKGEKVLTQGEAKEYDSKSKAATTEKEKKAITVNVHLGEKAVYIEHLDGENRDDLDAFVENLLEIIADRINREGAVFA